MLCQLIEYNVFIANNANLDQRELPEACLWSGSTMFVKYKCDVISKKVPYCGRNNVFLDQPFPHFCDSIFYKKW